MNIKKIYCYYENGETFITDNIGKAKDKENFRLANLSDLEFDIECGTEAFREKIEVAEGIVKWMEEWKNKELVWCGYILV